jgi:hypothetical protein
MSNFFITKVKYTKQLDNGSFKRVTEPYLVQATTFTDAEAMIYEQLGQIVKGEFQVVAISKNMVHDIFYYEECDTWYKCKIVFASDSDSEDSKTKNETQSFLVSATSPKDAYEKLQESLSTLMVDFEIPSINLSPLVDIFLYEEYEKFKLFSSVKIKETGEEGVVSEIIDKNTYKVTFMDESVITFKSHKLEEIYKDKIEEGDIVKQNVTCKRYKTELMRVTLIELNYAKVVYKSGFEDTILCSELEVVIPKIDVDADFDLIDIENRYNSFRNRLEIEILEDDVMEVDFEESTDSDKIDEVVEVVEVDKEKLKFGSFPEIGTHKEI